MSESSMIERVRPREMQWLLVGLTLGLGILDAYTSLWWLLFPVAALVTIGLYNHQFGGAEGVHQEGREFLDVPYREDRSDEEIAADFKAWRGARGDEREGAS